MAMPPAWMSAVLLDMPVTYNDAAGVTLSLTLKGKAVVDEPRFITWLAIEEMVGAVAAALIEFDNPNIAISNVRITAGNNRNNDWQKTTLAMVCEVEICEPFIVNTS